MPIEKFEYKVRRIITDYLTPPKNCGAPYGKYRTCRFCLPFEEECANVALHVEIPSLLR